MSTPQTKTLEDPPTDGITCLAYLGQKPLLASTSWDGSVRVHETTSTALLLSHALNAGPLLSLAVVGQPLVANLFNSTSGGGGGETNSGSSSGSRNADHSTSPQFLLVGAMDGSIRKLDMETSLDVLVGRHPATPDGKVACSCLSYLGDQLAASAGWHRQLHIWDIRTSSSSSSTQHPDHSSIATLSLPGKAFSMDVDPVNRNLIAVATSGRRICFIDIRRPTSVLHDTRNLALAPDEDESSNNTVNVEVKMSLDRESSLKYQTRCLRFFPHGNAIAIGSIEGRAAVEYIDELGRTSEGQKKFAFKCHRVGDMVYPVNSIAFHPRLGTFATGGCDGTVVIWDGGNKKKITTIPAFPTSVAAMAFNYDGSELAVASSYTFEEGEKEHPKDEIFIRPMLDVECAPKAKS